MQIHWWQRLGVRLATAIAVVTTVTLGLALVFLLRSQRQHLTSHALGAATVMSETVLGSIQYHMLRDEREDAYRIMGGIGRQPAIVRLRLIDATDTTIRFSKDVKETGRVANLDTDGCYPCHGRPVDAAREAGDQRAQMSWVDGHRVLQAVTPIYNDTTCSSGNCHVHPTNQRVLGVLEVGLSLDAVERDTASLQRNTSALIVLSSLALGLLTLAFVRRLVVRPVAALVQAAERIGAGDLGNQTTLRGTGEIATLGKAFTRMADALSTAQRERDQVLEHLEQQVDERTRALAVAQQKLVQTEKLSSLGRLSASIAHEINNPLAGILTVAKLLLRTFQSGTWDDKARASAVRHLSLVQRETERCTAIVRNLLGFARERQLSITDADINAAIDEALFLIGNQTALQSITVERRLGRVPSVRGDFGQLRQAFANLLINACDAMPRGGTLTVSSAATADGHAVDVLVADTGVGIPPDQLSKVLDPFFTTKEKGTGLGLSVVYGIVERHGGSVSVESVVGEGTRVTVRVPTDHATG